MGDVKGQSRETGIRQPHLFRRPWMLYAYRVISLRLSCRQYFLAQLRSTLYSLCDIHGHTPCIIRIMGSLDSSVVRAPDS